MPTPVYTGHFGGFMDGTPRERLRQARAVRRARTAALASLVPGLGHLVAGRRRTGLALLIFTLALILGLGAGAAALGAEGVERLSVRSDFLLAVTVGLVALGLFWCATILSAFTAARPAGMTARQRFGSSAVVLALCAAVLTPLGWGASDVFAAREVLTETFRSDLIDPDPVIAVFPAAAATASPSTNPMPAPSREPFVGKERINLLLLGGDGGFNRRGIRTDALILASIDPRNGDSALISLPRNLQNVPLRPGTRLAAAYPNGFADFWFGIYTAAESNPALMPHVRPENAGAAAITDTVSYVTGVPIDYYALVNMAGFSKITTALGGVTLDVRSGDGNPIPIGGSHAADGSVLTRPYASIPLGTQHLEGNEALWYARSRYAGGDAERQARQRCLLTAIARQADPTDLLRSVRKFTSAAKQVLLTTIPADVLPDFAELVRAHGKDARIDRVSVLDVVGSSVNPDLEALRARVAESVDPGTGTGTDSDTDSATAAGRRDYGVKRPICPTL